jgi:uncharacterized integral membrane protein
MELEHLRHAWSNISEKAAAQQSSAQQIRGMLRHKSLGVINTIKRNLLYELVAVVVLFGASIIFYYNYMEGRLHEIAWYMLAVALCFIAYYYFKNKLLNQMKASGDNVRTNLEKNIAVLEKYTRFYLLAGTALMPLTLLFIMVLFFVKFKDEPHTSIFFPSPQNPAIVAVLSWLVMITMLTFFIYHANVWYVRRLYGNHINRLRSLLRELTER